MGENKAVFREWSQKLSRWDMTRDLKDRSVAVLRDDGTLVYNRNPLSGVHARLLPRETAELIRLLTDERVIGRLVYGNPVREALEELEANMRETFEMETHARKEMARR